MYVHVYVRKSIMKKYNSKYAFTVVSQVSAHGYLNVTHDFGMHGRLPGTSHKKLLHKLTPCCVVDGCLPGSGCLWALAWDAMVIHIPTTKTW